MSDMAVIWDGRRSGPGGASLDVLQPFVYEFGSLIGSPLARFIREEGEHDSSPEAQRKARNSANRNAKDRARRLRAKRFGLIPRPSHIAPNKAAIWALLASPRSTCEIARALGVPPVAVSVFVTKAMRAGVVVSAGHGPRMGVTGGPGSRHTEPLYQRAALFVTARDFPHIGADPRRSRKG